MWGFVLTGGTFGHLCKKVKEDLGPDHSTSGTGCSQQRKRMMERVFGRKDASPEWQGGRGSVSGAVCSGEDVLNK